MNNADDDRPNYAYSYMAADDDPYSRAHSLSHLSAAVLLAQTAPCSDRLTNSVMQRVERGGALKMREWKMQEWKMQEWKMQEHEKLSDKKTIRYQWCERSQTGC